MNSIMQERIEAEIKEMKERSEKLMERVKHFKLIHEDILVVEKIDLKTTATAFYVPDHQKKDNLRFSYYGKVLKVNYGPEGIDSLDPVKEAKKGMVKVGDYVTFNPESNYCLNVSYPEEMPELWVMSIENILVVDSLFDPEQIKRKAAERISGHD